MKTVAIVPMKLNNRRLPQKNTKSFTNGNPLCHYILSTLLTVEGVDEVYVYCSNPDIQEFIPEGVKYLQRSTSLDQDTTKMNEVLHCFANEVPADIYVMTHTTAPFIKKNRLKKVWKLSRVENMTLPLLLRNCKIFCGKTENRSIMS